MMNLQDVAWGSMLKQSGGSGAGGSGAGAATVDTSAVVAAVTPAVTSSVKAALLEDLPPLVQQQVQRQVPPLVQQQVQQQVPPLVQRQVQQVQSSLQQQVQRQVQQELQQQLPAAFSALKDGLKPEDLYLEWQTGLFEPSADTSTTGLVGNNAVFTVEFPKPFSSVPQVWFSSVTSGSSRLERVQNISTTGFEYSCSYSPATGNVVQWVAFVPKP